MSVLAYYDDSFAGLLPCTAISVNGTTITLRCNVTRGGYQRGEVIFVDTLYTFPRTHFHRSRRGPFHFYTTPYKWADILAA